MICRLYRMVCRRYGPRGMTVSAWAWVYARETGNTRPRNVIDGIWMVLFNVEQHCHSSIQRESAQPGD